MVLSDRFSGDPNQSLVKRTALYVLAFGLGALAIAAVASFTLVSIAEGVLPGDEAKPSVESGTEVNVIGDEPAPKDGVRPTPVKRPSKGRAARGNEAPANDPI